MAALDNEPGLYSARYAGRHGDAEANRLRLLEEMQGVPAGRRQAFFICTLVLLRHAHDPAPLIAEGHWHGSILEAERGDGGFGYDPLFLPDGHEESAAEMSPARKNRLSHRARALASLRGDIDAWLRDHTA